MDRSEWKQYILETYHAVSDGRGRAIRTTRCFATPATKSGLR